MPRLDDDRSHFLKMPTLIDAAAYASDMTQPPCQLFFTSPWRLTQVRDPAALYFFESLARLGAQLIGALLTLY